MDLKRKLPGYVAWAMRLVVWPVAILVILGIAYFYSALRLASHMEGCAREMRNSSVGRGTALATAQDLAGCLDRKSGWVESLALHFQKGDVQSPPQAPCYYVAKWKATRPQSGYEVTLTADRRFVARAVKVQDRYEEGNVVTGAWIMEGQRRIAWLYDDAGRIWPPERNRVVDAGPAGFTIVEENGSRTRYELLERIAASDCAADPG